MSNVADSLGGDLHWSAGMSLISDIPKKPHWPVKTHIFINAGRLDAVDKCSLVFLSLFATYMVTEFPTAKSFQDNIHDCLSKPCVSAGFGLLYRLDSARMEVNFGVPLVASKSDGSRRGFQVGVGLDFL